jgi:hypothetical protein
MPGAAAVAEQQQQTHPPHASSEANKPQVFIGFYQNK